MGQILVVGAAGQLGSDLTLTLRNKFGIAKVIASDIKDPESPEMENGPFEFLDVLDESRLEELISKYKISEVYNLAAVLSAKAEKNPLRSWELNVQGLLNVLELGRLGKISKIFWPSSIAVFGSNTPRKDTPQYTITDPNTVYGISKLAGERWCEYYHTRYDVDVRSIRYPGLIGYKTPPGGGTTDYAVDIYFHAVEGREYICFLQSNTRLPMMYMDDAIRGTIQLMEANPGKIKIRSSYNLGAFSVSPEKIARSIREAIPEFKVSYDPDNRQAIADSWPESIDDRPARRDWGWSHRYGLDEMTEAMLSGLRVKA